MPFDVWVTKCKYLRNHHHNPSHVHILFMTFDCCSGGGSDDEASGRASVFICPGITGNLALTMHYSLPSNKLRVGI